MHCKDCKYWKRTDQRHIMGDCSNDKFEYWHPDGGFGVFGPVDGLVYGDYEMYKAFFATGPNFGCVHFQEKD